MVNYIQLLALSSPSSLTLNAFFLDSALVQWALFLIIGLFMPAFLLELKLTVGSMESGRQNLLELTLFPFLGR